MTAEPHGAPTRDLSARADIAVPGFFEDDAELEEFFEFVRADRQANLARFTTPISTRASAVFQPDQG